MGVHVCLLVCACVLESLCVGANGYHPPSMCGGVH